MRRRDFIKVIGGTVAWPLAVHAQQSSAQRVGVLSPLSPSAAASPSFEIFRKTFLDLGYVEGRSISLEYRWADGDPARLAAFAAELVKLKVDVIFCGPGTPTAVAAQKASATIPIVFVGAGDAVGAGLVAESRASGRQCYGLGQSIPGHRRQATGDIERSGAQFVANGRALAAIQSIVPQSNQAVRRSRAHHGCGGCADQC